MKLGETHQVGLPFKKIMNKKRLQKVVEQIPQIKM
jgi:hypothetical protein